MSDLTAREKALMESWPVEAVKRVGALEEAADELAYLLNGAEGSSGYERRCQDAIARYHAVVGRDELKVPEEYDPNA